MSRPTSWTSEELHQARVMRNRGVAYSSIDRVFDKPRGSARGILSRRFPLTGEAKREDERRRRKRFKKIGASERQIQIERSMNSCRVTSAALAEREHAFTSPRSPYCDLLGDPLPGRSALDKMGARS